ncbi:Dolichyl-phosphate-mannose-protein mannosyltransferase-domain-containing protein [Coemansia spiralis]|nr:Dolichyl-phosphate-mannose-protein mannosyltransferase-domain-containing protein [Coemansia spiralis]
MWPHNPLPITWLCRRLVRKRHPCLPLLLLTLVAFLLRVYKINRDPRVVWDETHFGRFASNYLAHTFYLDVHPPLAKLLITLMFRLLGYSGLFDFASGHAYPSNVPIRAMRIVQAAIGSLLVPSTYYLCRCLEMPLDASWLASVFVAFDNALVGISRIVVLDSMLLLANSLVVLALVRLLAFDKRSVAAWVIRLLVLGLALGVVCSCSMKLVGILTALLACIYVATDLISTFTNSKSIPKAKTVAIAFIHFATLLLLPLSIYTLSFWIHFKLFRDYTPSADNMGSEYSVSLNGSALQLQPLQIYNSSFVAIRAASFPFEYIAAKKIKQANDGSAAIQLSTTRLFEIHDYLKINLIQRASTINGSSAIANNSLVSLQAPGSSSHISVHYNYSFGGQGLSVGFAEHAPKYSMAQPLFVWKLKEEPRKQKQINVPGIAPIFSKFRLVSLFGGCELAINHAHYLQRVQPSKSMMHEYSLYCVTGKGTVWTIEHQLPTENHKIHNISKHAQPGFIKSMISYNRLMHEINGMLISDPDKYSIVESTPFSWPFLRLPMPMVEWSGNKIKYMLIGNPLLWWTSALVCIFVHPLLIALNRMLCQRSKNKVSLHLSLKSESLLWSFWAINYFFFFGLCRVTYLHHYLPALYFALLLLASYVYRVSWMLAAMVLPPNALTNERLSFVWYIQVAVVFLVILSSYFVAPMTYGIVNPCAYHGFNMIPFWHFCRLE